MKQPAEEEPPAAEEEPAAEEVAEEEVKEKPPAEDVEEPAVEEEPAEEPAAEEEPAPPPPAADDKYITEENYAAKMRAAGLTANPIPDTVKANSFISIWTGYEFLRLMVSRRTKDRIYTNTGYVAFNLATGQGMITAAEKGAGLLHRMAAGQGGVYLAEDAHFVGEVPGDPDTTEYNVTISREEATVGLSLEEPTTPATPPPAAEMPAGTAEKPVGKFGNLLSVSIDLDDLSTNPKVFQWRESTKKVMKEKSGTGGREIEGEFWNPSSPPILVWKSKEGEMFVVNGHHRFFFAKSLKDKTHINAFVIHEEAGDGFQYGWDQKSASAYGALENIMDESGTIEDYAKFFYNLKKEPTGKLKIGDAEQWIQKARVVAMNGYAIGTRAEADLYSLFMSTAAENKRFTGPVAAAIANAYPNDSDKQALGIKIVQEEASLISLDVLKNTLQASSNMVTADPSLVQAELPGMDAGSPLLKEWIAMGKVAAAIRREFKDQKNIGKAVTKKGKAASDVGVGLTEDKEDVKARVDKAAAQEKKWETWGSDPEMVRQVRDALKLPPIGETVEIDVPDAVKNALKPGETVEDSVIAGEATDVMWSQSHDYYLTFMEDDADTPWAILKKDGSAFEVFADEEAARERLNKLAQPPADDGPTLLEPDVDEATWRRARESVSEGADIDYSTLGPLTPKSFPDTPPTDFTEEEVAGPSDQMELWEGEESREFTFVSTNMTKPGRVVGPPIGETAIPERLDSFEQIAWAVHAIRNPLQERLVFVPLDGNRKVLDCGLILLAVGDASSVAFDVKQILQAIDRTGAKHFIIAHNHPSGIALPSEADWTLTETLSNDLKKAGLGGRLLDHIIIDGDTIFSISKSAYETKRVKSNPELLGGETELDLQTFRRNSGLAKYRPKKNFVQPEKRPLRLLSEWEGKEGSAAADLGEKVTGVESLVDYLKGSVFADMSEPSLAVMGHDARRRVLVTTALPYNKDAALKGISEVLKYPGVQDVTIGLYDPTNSMDVKKFKDTIDELQILDPKDKGTVFKAEEVVAVFPDKEYISARNEELISEEPAGQVRLKEQEEELFKDAPGNEFSKARTLISHIRSTFKRVANPATIEQLAVNNVLRIADATERRITDNSISPLQAETDLVQSIATAESNIETKKAKEASKRPKMKEPELLPAEEAVEEPPITEPDYTVAHRPDSGGPRVHDLLEGEMMPDDVYDRPDFYGGNQESHDAIQAARGNPEALVTVYRSAPPKVTEINPGDWVSLSEEYARQHGMVSEEELAAGERDWPVVSKRVPAKDVRFAGDDLNEFGYFPESPATPTQGELFALGTGVVKNPTTAKALKAKIAPLKRRWKNGPEIFIVKTIADLPTAGHDRTVRGVFYKDDGTVYLVADSIEKGSELETLFHESVGHFGVRQLLGAELNPYLDKVWRSFGRTELSAIINDYFPRGDFDVNNVDHRREVAWEKIAELAEGIPQTGRLKGLLQEFVALVRRAMRALGFNFKIELSNADILGLLRRSERRMATGLDGQIQLALDHMGTVEQMALTRTGLSEKWYSTLTSTLQSQRMPKKIKADTLRKHLKSWEKKGWVKPAEVKYSGLDDWLAEKGNAEVTKDAVLKQIKKQEVRIKEVLYDDKDAYGPPPEFSFDDPNVVDFDIEFKPSEFFRRGQTKADRIDEVVKHIMAAMEKELEGMTGFWPTFTAQAVQSLSAGRMLKMFAKSAGWVIHQQLSANWEKGLDTPLILKPTIRHEAIYALEAVTPLHRESESKPIDTYHLISFEIEAIKQRNAIAPLFLNLQGRSNPTSHTLFSADGRRLKGYGPRKPDRPDITAEISFALTAKGHPAFADRGSATRYGPESGMQVYTPGATAEGYKELLIIKDPEPGEPTYGSLHWDPKNIIAWVRFDERINPDTGLKQLYIQEIQSDWHQSSRKIRGKYLDEIAEKRVRAAGVGSIGRDVGTVTKDSPGFKEARAQAEAEVPEDWGYMSPEEKLPPGVKLMPFWRNEDGSVIEGSDVSARPGAIDALIREERRPPVPKRRQGDHGASDGWVLDITDAPEQYKREFIKSRPGVIVEGDKYYFDDRNEALIAAIGSINYSLSGEGMPGPKASPFKKEWPLLAMKRMIRWAAENDFQEVAWTSGEEQAARSNQRVFEFESVEIEKPLFTGTGYRAMDVGYPPAVMRLELRSPKTMKGKIDLDRAASDVWVEYDKDGIITTIREPDVAIGAVRGDHISTVIGSETAEKVLALPSWGSMQDKGKGTRFDIPKGKRPKFGGEALRKFYDEELANKLKKYLKKNWGVEIGETTAEFGGVEDEAGYHVQRKLPRLSFPITDAMREGVLEQPQAMWAKGRRKGKTRTSKKIRAELNAQLDSDASWIAKTISAFSGISTSEIMLRNALSTLAIEWSPEISREFNRIHGTNYEPRSVLDVDPQEIADENPDLFIATPECKRFSKMYNSKRVTDAQRKKMEEFDLACAEWVASVIRTASPPAIAFENVPDYKDSDLFKIITDALDEVGYDYKAPIVNAKDYGAAQSRTRMVLLAARKDLDVKLPDFDAVPKTGPTGWGELLGDLVKDAPVHVFSSARKSTRAGVVQDPKVTGRTETFELVNIRKSVKEGKLPRDKMILTMGGSLSEDQAAAKGEGDPVATLTSSGTVARILIPNKKYKKSKDINDIDQPDFWLPPKQVTPRMMARLMGLPDSVSVPEDRTFAKMVLGNGIHGAITENFIQPLLDAVMGKEDAALYSKIRSGAKRKFDPRVRAEVQKRVETGEKGMTDEEYDALLEDVMPRQRSVKIPTKRDLFEDDQLKIALDKDQRKKVGDHRNLPKGTMIRVRLDIPAWRGHKVAVQTIHEPNYKVIGYDTIGRVSSPKFIVGKTMQKVGAGADKTPASSVEGEYNPSREIPEDLASWTQVGYSPDRHFFYYDRDSGKPVISGDEAIIFGHTVFVKNAKFGDRGNFMYSRQRTKKGKITKEGRDFPIMRAARKYILGGYMLNQITEIYDKLFKGRLSQHQSEYDKLDAEKVQRIDKGNGIATRLSELSVELKTIFETLFYDSTVAEVTPHGDFVARFDMREKLADRGNVERDITKLKKVGKLQGSLSEDQQGKLDALEADLAKIDEEIEAERKRKPAWERLKKLYNSSIRPHKELDDLYHDVLNHLRSDYEDAKKALVDRIGRVFDQRKNILSERHKDNPEKLEAELKKLDKSSVDAQGKLSEMFERALELGIYFPLSRFGDYIVIATKEGEHQQVIASDTARAADESAEEYAADGWDVQQKVKKAYSRQDHGVPNSFVSGIFDVLDSHKIDDEQLKDDINQLIIRTLPDLSYRKHFIHRKKTPGYSRDVTRTFSHSAFHGAHHIARLNHADIMRDQLDAMQDSIDRPEEDATTDFGEVEHYEPGKKQQVLDELRRRYQLAMEPNVNPVTNALGSMGFLYMIGPSVGSMLVNMTQVGLFTLPWLGSRYSFSTASSELTYAYSLLGERSEKRAIKNWYDLRKSKKLIDSKKGAYDPLAMLNELEAAGTTNTSLVHDLSGLAKLDFADEFKSKSHRTFYKAMRGVAYPFHTAEVINRQVTAVAAYRLAYKKTKDHDKAVLVATEAVDKTHFDYTSTNRARYMQGNMPRLITMFKQYAHNVVFLQGRAIWEMYQGFIKNKNDPASREAATIAFRYLGGVYGLHFLAVGMMGMPFWTMASVLTDTLMEAFGDDEDDPWEMKTAFRNAMAEMLGPKAGEMLSHGVLRGLPVDVASRMNIDVIDMAFPRVSTSETNAKRQFNEMFVAAAGPMASVASNMWSGGSMALDGNFFRGLEKMVPKFLRDFMRGGRYMKEGLQTLSGEPLKDVTKVEAIGQMIGLAPASLAEYYEGREAQTSYEKEVGTRRRKLLSSYRKALKNNQQQKLRDLWEDIRKFNKAQPELEITEDTIKRSISGKKRTIEKTEAGVLLNKPTAKARRQGGFVPQGNK